MDALETALVERLSTANADAEVPSDLAARVVGTVRRKRRQRFAVAGAALAAVLVAVPVTMAVRQPERIPPPGDLSAGPTRVPLAFALPAALEARVDRGRALATVPVAQDGLTFRLESVAPDGTLVGGVGAPGTDGDRVGVVTPGSPRVRWLADPGADYAVRSAGEGIAAWTARNRTPGSATDIMCASARTGWQPVRLGVSGDWGRGLVVGGTVVAWSDREMGTRVSTDCGAARRIGRGAVAAVDGSTLYRLGYDARFERVDLGTEAVTKVPGISLHTSFFGASGRTMVAIRDEKMTIHRDGAVREIEGIFSAPSGAFADLTVGARVAAFAQQSRTRLDAWSWSLGVVVDLTSGARVDLDVPAFAAGDLLAWREGDHYMVAPVR
jgi:hypothetical protein